MSIARLWSLTATVSLFLTVNTEEALAERDKEEQTPERLADLRAEGVFGPNVICFISMSDDDRALQIEDVSARRLNTTEHYEEFRVWTELING